MFLCCLVGTCIGGIIFRGKFHGKPGSLDRHVYPRPGAVLEDVLQDRECEGYEPDDKVDPDGLVQDEQDHTQRERCHCFIF